MDTAPQPGTTRPVADPWDPALPLLAAVLAEMDRTRAYAFRVDRNGVVFHFPRRTVSRAHFPAIRVNGTTTHITADSLIGEQLHSTEQFLGQLSATRTHHQVSATLTPPLPLTDPVTGHTTPPIPQHVTLGVTVTWDLPPVIYARGPILLNTDLANVAQGGIERLTQRLDDTQGTDPLATLNQRH